MRILLIYLLIHFSINESMSQEKRMRDYGIEIGVLTPGKYNAITDVKGVKVGHTTKIEGDNIRTGVTAIVPHEGNIFQQKIPAAIYIGNGFGKLAGYSQVEELGNLETPIVLTNTLNVGTAVDALVEYTLEQEGNEDVKSVNAVVGETNDARLNDIRGRHVTKVDVLNAIQIAESGSVQEGAVGAGTGTTCFGYKGGIGTSSRVLPKTLGGYTIGVIVQSNYGGVLEIAGVPIGKELGVYSFDKQIQKDADGSCMIVVLTDAPLDARNLKRMAKRAFAALAKTGSIISNGSGDYVIAASTAEECRIPYKMEDQVSEVSNLHNDAMSPLFMATIEATEEALLNSMWAAKNITGNGRTIKALPKEKILEIMKKYGRINK